MSKNDQSLLFRGIYEFEDPSGTLVAAKIPYHGTADFYQGTAVVVKPNQCVLVIYKGQITDVLLAGTHTVETENLPIVSQLANWNFGFRNPLRCELWFFSGNVYTARRWGTKSPIIVPFEALGSVPIRAFGNYNIVVQNPEKLFHRLIGSRNSFAISDLEDFVQGQLLELLPNALKEIKNIHNLQKMQDRVSKILEKLVHKELVEYGIAVKKIQIVSLLPTKDIIRALDEKAAMQILGNKQEYLLYKAANSLDALRDNSSNDSMQMMLGMMLGKGLMNHDYHNKENLYLEKAEAKQKCASCGEGLGPSYKFCTNCGGKVAA